MMKIGKESSVNAALRTLTASDRRKVLGWIGRLKNWEADELVQQLSRPSPEEGVSALETPDDLRVFFTLDLPNKQITIVDISKPSRYAHMMAAAE